jgi:hypothetical protein
VTTSAIRRRYGHGAARLCLETRHVRYEISPPLLPNATSGAATVLIGGLTVFALLRAIQPPEELPSDIQIVQLQELPPEPPPPPPEPEQVLQPLPEPPPEPKPEPVVVAKAEPPPKPPPVVKKVEPPKHREPPPKPKPVLPPPPPVAPEPAPMWKAAPIAPPPPKPIAPPAPPAQRPPPVVVQAPKPVPVPVVAEAPQPDTRTQWKPVALPDKPAATRAPAPKVAIDAVTASPAPTAETPPPSRVASLPPGVPGPTTQPAKPVVRPVAIAPAAAAPDLVADAAPASTLARSSVPSPTAPVVNRRPPPTKGMAMPGISADRANAPAAAAATDTRDYARQGVAAPPRETARSEPNQKLHGVPLGSLAACRTDRLEDDLKQQVLGAVRDREDCTSAAGHYRFVETKNLNAFLMWIERAPGRAEGDRCAELSFALACLRKSGGAR